MIRRSSGLQLAEFCTMSAELAARHPNTSPAARKGTDRHSDVANWLTIGTLPTSPEGKALAESDWIPPAGVEAEVRATLHDPEGGDVLTEGTADCVWVEDGVLHVVDWKTGQIENVEEAASNLQIAAYGAAIALARGLEAYRAGLCFLRAEGPIWDWAPVVRGAEMWGPINRIAAIARKPVAATTGPHCASMCYARAHCAAFLLPADPVARDLALVPTTEVGLATPEKVAGVSLAAAALEEMAERAKAWVRAQVEAQGPIRVGDRELALTEVAGRKSVSVKDVEAAGHPELVKVGANTQRLAWRNVKPHQRKAS